jgi:hypothetical protein
MNVRSRWAIGTLLMITLTTACHPGQFNSTPAHGFNQAARQPFSSNGPNTDFWGNPLPVKAPPGADPDAVGNSAGCDVPKTEQEPAPGYEDKARYARIRTIVFAFRGDPNTPLLCRYGQLAPIGLHYYVGSNLPGTLQIQDNKTGAPLANPYDRAATATPWENLVSIPYTLKEGPVTTVDVSVIASYEPDGTDDYAHPVQFGCAIFAEHLLAVRSLVPVDSAHTKTVQCRVRLHLGPGTGAVPLEG